MFGILELKLEHHGLMQQFIQHLLQLKRYPQQSETATSLSPFTITSSTDKKDTRARGRFVNVKIENDSASESWRFGTLKIDVQPDGRR